MKRNAIITCLLAASLYIHAAAPEESQNRVFSWFNRARQTASSYATQAQESAQNYWNAYQPTVVQMGEKFIRRFTAPGTPVSTAASLELHHPAFERFMSRIPRPQLRYLLQYNPITYLAVLLLENIHKPKALLEKQIQVVSTIKTLNQDILELRQQIDRLVATQLEAAKMATLCSDQNRLLEQDFHLIVSAGAAQNMQPLIEKLSHKQNALQEAQNELLLPSFTTIPW